MSKYLSSKLFPFSLGEDRYITSSDLFTFEFVPTFQKSGEQTLSQWWDVVIFSAVEVKVSLLDNALVLCYKATVKDLFF